jgi:hypothetical protein
MNNGFDPTLFGASRVNNYINKAYQLICRRVQYYTDETTQDFNTAAGTVKYALPANFARIRELYDTNRNLAMQYIGLRDLDQAQSSQQGPPIYYALDGANMHLYPTPDGVYPLELRYWLLPPLLVADTDVPTLPADWHDLLWMYSTARCYKAEDDPNMAQSWMDEFNENLAMFAADAKFPDTDYPTVAKSMWDEGSSLQQRGWSLWGWW